MRLGLTFTRRGFLASPILALAQAGSARFLSFAEVGHVLAHPAEPAGPVLEGREAWDQWVREEDRRIRTRIDGGVEDSISNLILFGTSFTKLPRAAGVEEAGTDLVRARVHALVMALANNPAGERLVFIRSFLKERGAALEKILMDNLRRYAAEQRFYAESMRRTQRYTAPSC